MQCVWQRHNKANVDTINTYSSDGHDWTSELSGHLQFLLLKSVKCIIFLSNIIKKPELLKRQNIRKENVRQIILT